MFIGLAHAQTTETFHLQAQNVYNTAQLWVRVKTVIS